VHQWKYGEGEGEDEVEERRKMERETSPPFNPVLHPPLRVRQWLGGKKKNGEKEMKKKRPAPPEPPMKVRSLELRKKALDTLHRLKMKVEPAVKFSPP
jgi:hypothetical protein